MDSQQMNTPAVPTRTPIKLATIMKVALSNHENSLIELNLDYKTLTPSNLPLRQGEGFGVSLLFPNPPSVEGGVKSPPLSSREG